MGDDHLAHAELGRVAEHLGFLVGQLQDPDVPQQVAVEFVVEPQRPDLRDAHEPLAVERDAAPLGERGNRLERELVPGERRNMHPPP